MPYPDPIRVCPVDEEIIFSETDSQYNVRPNGNANENVAVNRVTTYRYDGKLWQVCHDIYGDMNDVELPAYQKHITFINYSSDNGATWEPNDSSLRIVGGRTFTDAQVVTQMVGSKIWAFHTITDWSNPSFGVFNDQSRLVRVDYFDCDTLTWTEDVATNAGPSMTWADGSFMSPDNYINLSEAIDIGGGVLVVGHDEAQSSDSIQAGVYSVFDTATAQWSALNTFVFDFTADAGTWSGISGMAFDGTYLHFWSSAAIDGARGRLHRTLDSGFSLGSTSDIYAGYPGSPSFPASMGTAAPNSECFPIVHGGEVIVASHAKRGIGSWPTMPWNLNRNIIICRCSAGVQNPTWTTWELTGSTDWDTTEPNIFTYGEATYPCLVENAGDVYLIFGTSAYYTSPFQSRMHIRAQKYLGSGSWEAAVKVWDYKEWTGLGAGDLPEDTVVKYSPIGNNGTDGTDGINWAASFPNSRFKDGPPTGGDSIYFFGYRPPADVCVRRLRILAAPTQSTKGKP